MSCAFCCSNTMRRLRTARTGLSVWALGKPDERREFHSFFASSRGGGGGLCRIEWREVWASFGADGGGFGPGQLEPLLQERRQLLLRAHKFRFRRRRFGGRNPRRRHRRAGRECSGRSAAFAPTVAQDAQAGDRFLERLFVLFVVGPRASG